MLALQRRQETLANNLANINTPGYKQDEGVLRSFPEQLISRIRDAEGPDVQGLPNFTGQPVTIGRLHTGVYLSEALANFAQGDITETNNPYDVALLDNLEPVDMNGQAVERRLFFSVARMEDPTQPVADPAQIRYTRNGNWMVNQEGYLVTADGYYVLDHANRSIRVNSDPNITGNGVNVGGKLKVSETGELLMPDPNGAEGQYIPLDPATSPRLGLKVVTDPSQLVREGNNLYRWEGQNAPIDVTADPTLEGFYGVKQGWSERSNVDAMQTTTDMMTVLRAYEANQRVITTLDGTMDKAVNEIGRVT